MLSFVFVFVHSDIFIVTFLEEGRDVVSYIALRACALGCYHEAGLE